MVLMASAMAALVSMDREVRWQSQILFDKLVSIADYTVKSGAVVREGPLRHPNWIDPALLGADYENGLKEKAGLDALEIFLEYGDGAGGDAAVSGFQFPVSDGSGGPGFGRSGGAGRGTCIYRLVVSGPGRDISRLLVCGR
jgi:hypothetical protein